MLKAMDASVAFALLITSLKYGLCVDNNQQIGHMGKMCSIVIKAIKAVY
jgi:hypothetical protein